MKLSSLTVPSSVLLATALLAGCVTRSKSRVSSAEANAPAVAGVPPGSVEAEAGKLPGDTPPALSTEAAEVVARFTHATDGEALPHEVADTTSFPEAMASLQPGARAPKFEYQYNSDTTAPAEGLTADGNSTRLVVRDWTGLVLVPISTSLSVAHTSAVRLLKVEAHPLNDGRVRVWVRVKNAGRNDLTSEVACLFQMHSGKTASSPYFYGLPVPSAGYRDVFFVSPEGTLNTYTVLVRQSR